MHIFNKSDNSSDNGSMSLLPNRRFRTVEFDALGYFLAAITIAGVLLSWVLNIVVIKALNRVGDNRIKVKFLLQNAIFGDILLSIAIGCRVIFQLAGIDDQEDNISVISQCLNVAYDAYGYFAAFYQIFASMALAIDRFFSMLKPLSYHTMKYTTAVKALAVAVIFTVALSLSIPMVFLKVQPGEEAIAICYRAQESAIYTEEILPFVVLGAVLLTLLIYCGVFVLVAHYRRIRHSVLGEQREHKGQVRLAMTFFFIHITYVLLYIPGALYFSVIIEDLFAMPKLSFSLSQVAILLYLCNAIIDPLIYMTRIPSIREQVRLTFRREPGSDAMDNNLTGFSDMSKADVTLTNTSTSTENIT